MRGCLLIILLTFTALAGRAQERDLLRLIDSEVRFTSVAPLETITAACVLGSGLIDRADRTFAVQLPVVDFMGFNAPLQREHFHENYMSVEDWPHATFTGRIIEAIDLGAPGKHAVRAKGVLTIRGQAVERVIPCAIDVAPSGLSVSARFEVPVADHGIRIPRVVQQKVAAVVQVEARLSFAP
ncbi:MAG: YceI family protein [Flavobacteriales bacterium]|jgi:hypothetical protein|nr:YceI family protein [Flavobacteriales bacterium]